MRITFDDSLNKINEIKEVTLTRKGNLLNLFPFPAYHDK